jgi:hypothetical protein
MTREGTAAGYGQRLAAVGMAVREAAVDVLTGQAARGWPLRELPAS